MQDQVLNVEPIKEPQPPEPPAEPAPEPSETIEPEPITEGTAPESTQAAGEPGGPVDAAPKLDEALLKTVEKLEKRVGYLQRQLERQPAAPEPEPEPEIVSSKPKPQQADFETYDDYVEALTDWKVDARLEAQEREKQTQTRTQNIEEFKMKVRQDGEKAHEDFAELISDPTLQISAAMIEILQDCENPHEVAYYLGKNPKEAASIANMPPVRAARVMGSIAAEIAANLKKAGNPEPPPKPKKTVTDAPEPINPIGPGEVITKPPEKMTQAEYEQARREGRL